MGKLRFAVDTIDFELMNESELHIMSVNKISNVVPGQTECQKGCRIDRDFV